MGLSRAPAAGATFQLSHKADPDASRTVSVAAFFQERFGSPLAFPQLPVVEMKPWRRATQMWLVRAAAACMHGQGMHARGMHMWRAHHEQLAERLYC